MLLRILHLWTKNVSANKLFGEHTLSDASNVCQKKRIGDYFAWEFNGQGQTNENAGQVSNHDHQSS